MLLQTIRSHICKISSLPEDVIPLADLVFICLPGPFIRKTLERIKPYLKRDVIVGSVVSNTGFFFQAHDIISEFSIFGFQRVPFICRIKEYGKKAVLLGFKKSLSVCVENGDGEYIRSLLEALLHTPVRLLDNYYEATLSIVILYYIRRGYIRCGMIGLHQLPMKGCHCFIQNGQIMLLSC